jgi:hypothetical protein
VRLGMFGAFHGPDISEVPTHQDAATISCGLSSQPQPGVSGRPSDRMRARRLPSAAAGAQPSAARAHTRVSRYSRYTSATGLEHKPSEPVRRVGRLHASRRRLSPPLTAARHLPGDVLSQLPIPHSYPPNPAATRPGRLDFDLESMVQRLRVCLAEEGRTCLSRASRAGRRGLTHQYEQRHT